MPDVVTPTEQLLLDMNANGCTQKQIAASLNIGFRQVRRMVVKLRLRGHTVVSQRSDRPDRPHQVAEMLSSGMTCREVAAKLRLSATTVRDLQRKAKKMGLSVPPLSERDKREQTFDRMRREIQTIRAPDVKFNGKVFDDVVFKRK